MKKIFKRMLALMAALAVVLSVPMVRMIGPGEGTTTQPPVYEEWDEDATRD